MKKIYALLLACFYLLASTASVNAEAAIQENKDFQENVLSVKGVESAVNHFSRAPRLKNSHTRFFERNSILVADEPVCNISLTSPVPIFIRNCNFRR